METQTKQFCTFYVDSLYLGISVQDVQEVIRYQEMTRAPRAPGVVSGLINLRGQIVTALDLRYSLGLSPRINTEYPMNVIVRDGDNVVSFLVDRIGDVVEVDPGSFELPPLTLSKRLRHLIEGAYKMEDKLLLVLSKDNALNENDAHASADVRVAI